MSPSTAITITVLATVTTVAAVSESATAIALGGHVSHCVAGVPSSSATRRLPAIAERPPIATRATSRLLSLPSG